MKILLIWEENSENLRLFEVETEEEGEIAKTLLHANGNMLGTSCPHEEDAEWVCENIVGLVGEQTSCPCKEVSMPLTNVQFDLIVKSGIVL